MYVGVDYYPEHWPEERWPQDARMMREAGFNVVRMAEFAWIKLEPVEGIYDFSWLDRAIEILHHEDINVILGTPTGSMPAWVALKYPEAVATDIKGDKIPYGARKDNCPTSLSYRLLSQRITEAMAKHYADNPAVIGWQTDNEFGAPNCYCHTCKAAWHDWLARRFGTIDRLNESWGTIFWGHTYRTWEEVPLPQRDGSNPSLALDYARFYSDQVVSFQKEQIDILRRVSPHHFITHNFMGFYDNLDYYKLAQDLDFVSWDYYYNWNWNRRMEAYLSGAAAHDLMRGLKHRNFWIMETSAGPTGSSVYSRNLRPGEMRRMNYQAVAHGADGLLWFRWRTCRFGHEQYWHGLLPHDGIPGRRYKEAAQVAHEFAKIAPEIEGSTIKAPVAICLSYDDRWAFRIQPNSKDFNYTEHLLNYYKALRRQGVDVDFVKPDGDLMDYRLLILPTAYIITPSIAENLKRFVKDGGVLVTTFRSGVKDEYNVPYDLTLPGLLREMAGIRIEEYEALDDSMICEVAFDEELGGGRYKAGISADWIIPEEARAIARYCEKGLEEYAAATLNSYGKGKVYYIGTWFLEEAPYEKLISKILGESQIEPIVRPPAGVEVTTRNKGGQDYIFLLNHDDNDVSVEIPRGYELITGKDVGGLVRIPGGEVMIVRVQ